MGDDAAQRDGAQQLRRLAQPQRAQLRTCCVAAHITQQLAGECSLLVQPLFQRTPGQGDVIQFHVLLRLRIGVGQRSPRIRVFRRLSFVATLVSLMPSTSPISR